jgi:hypothetical protein
LMVLVWRALVVVKDRVWLAVVLLVRAILLLGRARAARLVKGCIVAGVGRPRAGDWCAWLEIGCRVYSIDEIGVIDRSMRRVTAAMDCTTGCLKFLVTVWSGIFGCWRYVPYWQGQSQSCDCVWVSRWVCRVVDTGCQSFYHPWISTGTEAIHRYPHLS